MILYRTPGRSFTRPPRTSTIECSWRLWPIPGMYAVTSTPVVSRTRATLRSAEFGFFGVCVNTRVQTPRRCGELFNAGVLVFSGLVSRPLRTSWAIVGTRLLTEDLQDSDEERRPRVVDANGPSGRGPTGKDMSPFGPRSNSRTG